MAAKEPRVACATPTPGKKSKNIPQWKYDAIRTAIRKVVPRNKEGIEFAALFALVEQALSAEDKKNLGSIPWHTTHVKLDMECKGELERVPDSKPQRLRRVR
jgi:hypothetical protein